MSHGRHSSRQKYDPSQWISRKSAARKRMMSTKTSSQSIMPRTTKTVVKHPKSSDDEEDTKSDDGGDIVIKLEDSSSTDELPPPPPQRRTIPKKRKRPRSSSSSSSGVRATARSSGTRSWSGEPAPKREARDRGRQERPRPSVHRHGDPGVQHLIDTRELRYVINGYKYHRKDYLKRLNKLENTCCCNGCLRHRESSDK